MHKEYKRRAWQKLGCIMFRENWESMIEEEQFEKSIYFIFFFTLKKSNI